MILMTNARVVLCEMKVSGEAGNSRTPADTSHEDTGVLDATLSICKVTEFSSCQTFQAPPFSRRKEQKCLGPSCDVIYVLVWICCIVTVREIPGDVVKANGPLWMLVTLLLSPIQRLTASGHLPSASLHHGISAGTSPLRLTSSQSSSASAEVK